MTSYRSRGYEAGRWWAICDRCGFKLDGRTLRAEWTNLRVCDACWDPRPPELDSPLIDPREGSAVPDPRPRPADVFLSDGDVTADDL